MEVGRARSEVRLDAHPKKAKAGRSSSLTLTANAGGTETAVMDASAAPRLVVSAVAPS